MPELPEVETIVRNLRQGPLIGHTISAAHLFWPRSLAVPSEAELHSRLPGQTLRSISRRGKFLLFSFDPDTLLIHLRMSGDLSILPTPPTSPLNPLSTPLSSTPSSTPNTLPSSLHARFILDFDNQQSLVFNDPRKFGRLWLVRDPQAVLGDLGPEPLDPAFTPQQFHARLAERKRQLKPLLLDQTFIAGLGNIYTDEALHLARLHPLSLSNQLTPKQSETLLMSMRSVLEEGIRHNGASIDWVYRGGDFQNHFRTYQRTGQPCPVCGAPIQRITLGQRGTHICPTCQPPPKISSPLL